MKIKQKIKQLIPDRLFLQILFRRFVGYRLNLRSPKSFNEKLQWLKLYNRQPIYTTMVDKYSVKDYVASAIGKKYVIPNLGNWNSFEEINFNKLPDQFVLKTTHDSGSVIVVKNKAKFDAQIAKNKLDNSLKRNFYYQSREWPYKNVQPRIIAEPYMEDKQTGELDDYKFYTFNGKVKLLLIATERRKKNTETKFDFFDEKFNHLPFTEGGPNAIITPKKPECFELMKRIAEKLGKGIPYVRVDLYQCNHKVYFGELTFFPNSGLVPFHPRIWDYKLGNYLKLPTKKIR